ncbi:hypothetical protein [Pseudoalteromonas denitrificans]|nr:hypothetical protein [Pseudoalteromonas denitrificans]
MNCVPNDEQNLKNLIERQNSHSSVPRTYLDLPYKNYERREQQVEKRVYYDKLSLAQKVTISELGRFGYLLRFVRGKYSNCIAILSCGEKIATVNRCGETDITPDVKIR